MNASTHLLAPLRILVAEDEPEIRDYLQLALKRPDFVVDFAEDGEEVLNALAEKPSVVILDILMPRKDGISTLIEIRRRNPDLPVIMLSGLSTATYKTEAMKNGANSYLTKPVSHDELRQAVELFLPSIPVVPRRKLAFPDPAESHFVETNWMQSVESVLTRVAACDVPVLVQGETGVGKEVLARRIHGQSLRSEKIFLKLNCAALPSELVESELFGYERGAFTGALKNNPGKFELANGGTILLDEIGDMDLRLQAKLLQVLQDQQFLRLGAKEATQVDVRVIAATHRNLEALVADGAFREDLYYRLHVFNIEIPPLRKRLDEIIPLASLFLKKHAVGKTSIPEISPDLRIALLEYNWPGNIRELENVMRKYLVMRNAEIIAQELKHKLARTNQRASSHGAGTEELQLRSFAAAASAPTALFDEPLARPMDYRTAPSAKTETLHLQNDMDIVDSDLARVDQARRQGETEIIKKALYETQWNRKRAAALLGLDYKALLYKIKKLGID